MSWSVTGNGSKHALKKLVDRELNLLIKSRPDTAEYVAAKEALHALLNSMPDVGLYALESWGSFSVYRSAFGKHTVNADTRIGLKTWKPV